MGSEKLFGQEKIGKLIVKTAGPSVLIILMMMVYNMADIFFIGRTGDSAQVAAVSLAGPIISILSGIGTLIGAGGTTAIAAALGKGDRKLANSMSSFASWVSIGIGIVFGLVVTVAIDPILGAIGTSSNTIDFARSYLSILAIGAPAMIFSSVMANVVRGQGAVKQSMAGNMLGNLVNIILDPLLISSFGLGVAGAAIATVIGNIVASVYFVLFMKSKKSELSMKISDFTLKKDVSMKILSLGAPTAFGVILMSVSSMIQNNVAAGYGDSVIAASGVAGRVAMIVSMVQLGICMGVQPALAYNYGAGLVDRMKSILKYTAISSLTIGTALAAIVFMGRASFVGAFINNPEIVELGQYLVAISMVTGPIFGISVISTTFLQSTDKASLATIASILRQGVFLLPLTFIMNAMFGFTGFIWSGVVSDILSTIVTFLLFARQYRAVFKQGPTNIFRHTAHAA